MLTFLVSRTVDSYIPPDDPEAEAIDGDTDGWFKYQDQPMEFRDVIRELREMNWLSESHPQAGTWASQEHTMYDCGTGETRADSVHISHVNGKPITSHQIRRLFRAAGIK